MSFSVEVWGPHACFTRPELKGERVSYEVMTPSAARGILEAIFWHGGMRYVIDSIQVCNPIQFTSIQTNELANTIRAQSLLEHLEKGGTSETFCYGTRERQQRTSLILKDVRYIINAHFDMTDRRNPDDSADKFFAEICKRAKKGQCFHQPYFGCRDYSAHFTLYDGHKIECPEELKGNRSLGLILYDKDYENESKPMFFVGTMKDGLLTIPQKSEVLR